MAEVGQVDVPSSTSPRIAPIPESQSASPPQGDSSPRLDDHQPPPSAEISHQQVLLENPPPEKSAPEHSDDEVEFVFSVPRRRKKRRRRLEIPPQGTHIESSSPIPSAEVSVPHPSRDKSMADIASLLAPATEPDDMGMARCRSIHALHSPTTFESSLQPLNVLQSDLSDPSPLHVSQTMPFKIPPPWYAKSMPPPPSPMSPYYYSKSATFTLPEQDYAKKRKHEDDSNKHSSEHSNYVSPYKVSLTSIHPPRSKAVSSHSEFSTTGGHMGFVDFLEDPNVPTTFGGVPPPLPPHRPIIPGWQDFSWKPVDYPPSTCPSSVDSRTRILNYTSNDPEWHRKYYYGVGDSRCFNLQQIPTRNSQHNRFEQDMVSPKSTPHEIQMISAPYSLGLKEPIPKPSPAPTRLSASATTAHTAHSPRMLFSKPTTCTQPVPRIATVRSPSPPPRPQVTAADIRRNPSLYKVPAWPYLREDSQATCSMALGECLSQTCDPESSNSSYLYHEIPQQAKAIASHTQNEASSSPQKPIPQPPKQQALAPKHSPNLIIDIAQTSQETFPFAAVAARHNKPVQKVFDIFSAIVQLPLLKQAADGRRHGPLGSERMRQYREAKRAMERANREREKGKGVRRGGEGTE